MLAFVAGAVVFAALTVYALLGGADFGGGVWDLAASGPRAGRQRDLVARAIAPIWEANHVWLILVIVAIWIAFPRAYATIGTALHVPLTLMLIGIVLRGSSFVFRAYGSETDEVQRRWGLAFAVSSVFTPVMLGASVGAVASGRIRVDPESGVVTSGFFAPWLAPFPLAVGLFTLALFAWLAAVYLCVEADDDALADDFRVRGLAAAGVSGALAFVSLWLARDGAPVVLAGLVGRWWSLPFQGIVAACALGAVFLLWARRYKAARALAVVQVALVVNGWGVSQYPYVIVPDLVLADVAAPDSVLTALLVVLGVGSVLLVPAFVTLYRVFKPGSLV